MKPLMLQGCVAFSPFRIDALAEKIGRAVATEGKVHIEARFVYLLETADALDGQTDRRAHV